jgi:hypothetical protein
MIFEILTMEIVIKTTLTTTVISFEIIFIIFKKLQKFHMIIFDFHIYMNSKTHFHQKTLINK